MATVQELRDEAYALIQNDDHMLAMRSCWDCNGAHEHLRNAEYVIWCFGCGRYLFKGTDITDYGSSGSQ